MGGSHGTTQVAVQALDPDIGWITAFSEKEGQVPGGWKMIMMNPNPTTSPSISQVPTLSPSVGSQLKVSSSQWRILALSLGRSHVPIWDIYTLEMYSSKDCTGEILDGGKPIHSGQHPDTRYNPESAFDGNPNTLWGGRRDSEGLLWLGMEYEDGEKTVECVRYNEMGSHGTTQVAVQALDPDIGWITVFSEKEGQVPGGWKTIVNPNHFLWPPQFYSSGSSSSSSSRSILCIIFLSTLYVGAQSNWF